VFIIISASNHQFFGVPGCFNLGGLACFCCIGFGFSEPDGGSYPVWESKVRIREPELALKEK
jgi:hypothetical protein